MWGSEAGVTRCTGARPPAGREWTGLEDAALTTNRSPAPATIFSRVCAPPPPLTSQPSGAIWSAPSMVMSNRSVLGTSSILRPSARAACSVRGDVAAQTMLSDRLARAGSRYATVDPVPSPTVMPFSTSSAAASAAICFSRSVLMTVCLHVAVVSGHPHSGQLSPGSRLPAQVSTGRAALALGHRQHAVELVAGADAELGEDLGQVVLDGMGADKQPGADLGVGQAVAGQPRDLGLLCGQLVAGRGGGARGAPAGGVPPGGARG